MINFVKNCYTYFVECLFRSNHADEIITGIWVGDVFSSKDLKFLNDNKIEIIINCTKEIPFSSKFKGEKYRIPIFDNPNELETLKRYIDDYVEIINENLLNKKNILIHCRAGRQRSTIVLAYYIQKILKYKKTTTIDLIKTQRPLAFWPHITFEEILI